MENKPLNPLLTPAQKSLLKYGKIPDLIARFDLHSFSSPEAIINTKIHNRTQTLLASFSGTKPDIINTSEFAPLSDSGASAVKSFERTVAEAKLPKGLCLDDSGKTIFDRNFLKKGIQPKELPLNHPDYVPF